MIVSSQAGLFVDEASWPSPSRVPYIQPVLDIRRSWAMYGMSDTLFWQPIHGISNLDDYPGNGKVSLSDFAWQGVAPKVTMWGSAVIAGATLCYLLRLIVSLRNPNTACAYGQNMYRQVRTIDFIAAS